MSQQEQLHRRKQRSREDVVSTFPETMSGRVGAPDGGADELLDEIVEILAHNETVRRQLGSAALTET